MKFLLTLSIFLSFVIPVFTEEKTSTDSYPIGELGDGWQFPSDHLPVGGSVGNVNFVMWNILNTDYLHHIISNSQGLKDSLIMHLNLPEIEGELFTQREAIVIENVRAMIHHPETPRSLIALQETGKEVYKKLEKTLPPNMKMIPSSIEDLMHGDIFIYDENTFDFIDFSFARYEVNSSNTMMTLTLLEKSTGLVFRFFQSHVPGGPINSDPARKELANALFNDFNPEAITLVMGDMNRSPDFFLKNFESAAQEREVAQPFTNLVIPYPTHINTHQEAAWIDNIFVSNPFPEVAVKVSNSEHFFDELKLTTDLLESLKK